MNEIQEATNIFRVFHEKRKVQNKARRKILATHKIVLK